MSIVCGVDCHSLEQPNYVAWLEEEDFTLDLYIPTAAHPLPELSVKPGEVSCIALDAPQGLPVLGHTVRRADVDARIEGRPLPLVMKDLSNWKTRRAHIEIGVAVFRWVHEQNLGTIPGLSVGGRKPFIVETDAGYIASRMWPTLRVPSKSAEPLTYVDTLYSEIQKLGYLCRSVIHPSVQQLDAMLCALAARAFVDSGGRPSGMVGEDPVLDPDGHLRGGLIVAM